jgi:hypothetical protein
MSDDEAPDVDVRVLLSWQDVGEIRLDGGGDPVFPDLAAVPGVYRITLTAGSEARPRVYLGETVSLQTAASRFRHPGTGQQTNSRINAALRAYLSNGGTGRLSVAVAGTVEIAGRRVPLDLTVASYRRLAGNAAQVWADVTLNVTTLNLTMSKSVGAESFSFTRTDEP